MGRDRMIKFGTGGWRALIGDEFIKDNIVKLAQSLANLMKEEGVKQKGIVIGYDKRFLSDVAAQWIAEVFAANGISVNFIKRVSPTPLIMYSVKKLDVPYGIAVTASHNPASYNGIKIFTKGGKDADLDVTDRIEKHFAAVKEEDIGSLPFEKAVDDGIVRIINPFNDYIDTIISMLDVESIRNQELIILLDPMYGVSKTALQTLLMTARCEVDIIHDAHDTNFGGRMPSPSEETLSRLMNTVVEKHYDLGIGTDGDADRLGIIDETGRFIHPNMIMCLLYYYLLKYKKWKGPVVRNLATTHMLDAIAEAFGETCIEVPVGFKHISKGMMDHHAIIGGESSGGLTISGHIRGKDGIFAAGLLVEMISVTGKKLGDMIHALEEDFGTFCMVESNLTYSAEDRKRLTSVLLTEKQLPEFSFEVDQVSYMDGVKVTFKNGGWILARFSGTEPLIRIFAEMSNEADAKQTIHELNAFLFD